MAHAKHIIRLPYLAKYILFSNDYHMIMIIICGGVGGI